MIITRNTTIISLLFLLALSPSFVFAYDGDDEHENKDSGSSITEKTISSCLSLSDKRDECYFSLCGTKSSYLCTESIIDVATKVGGPEVGVNVLHEILESSIFGITSNGHSLGHVIGRSAARNWGTSGVVFNRCPIDFDYGCVHGFFEVAMTKVQSPTQALIQICEDMPDEPIFDKVNCYHGGGHGMMMNENYNLHKALDICDSLPEHFMQLNCWGGVFMENANGFFGDRIEEEFNTFRSDNPLAPCDSVDSKHRDGCYTLHADYLINAYSTSLNDLIAACLKAEEHIEACLKGVARIFAADRQEMILQGSGLDLEGDFVDKTFYLCSQFPEQYIQSCHLFVVAHFIFPENLILGFENSKKYCMLISSDRKECFKYIGRRLTDLVSADERSEMCQSVPVMYQDSCLDISQKPDSGKDTVPNSAIVTEVHEEHTESFFSRIIRFFVYILTHGA